MVARLIDGQRAGDFPLEYLWEILEGGGCLAVAGKPFEPTDLDLGSLNVVPCVPPDDEEDGTGKAPHGAPHPLRC
jgi:hypothetical protein